MGYFKLPKLLVGGSFFSPNFYFAFKILLTQKNAIEFMTDYSENVFHLNDYLILGIQDISQTQTSSSARNGGDLSTTNYVWDTNNMNICFQLFGNATQSSCY